MTFASFILVSALGAGADTVVMPATHAAPIASAPAAGCCTATPAPAPAPAPCGCDTGCGSAPVKSHKSGGLFGGLFSKSPKASSSDCGCAPAPAPCAAPAPTPCDPCSTATKKHSKPSFFGSFFGGHKKSAPAADCGCSSGCETTNGTVITTTPVPAHAPAPGAVIITPAPAALPSAPTVPAAPASTYHGTPGPISAPSPMPMPLPATVAPAAPPATEIKKTPAPLPAAEPVKKIGAAPTAPTITPAAAKVEGGTTNPFDGGRRLDTRVARASDDSSLVGELTYVHADGGLWVLRYAPLGTEDAHGGAVILGRDSRLSGYREGDLVKVQGKVVEKRGSTRLAAPLYQATEITLVERTGR